MLLLPGASWRSVPAGLLCSWHSLCHACRHQPHRQSPWGLALGSPTGRSPRGARDFAFRSQARRAGSAESCLLLLRSSWFLPLLPTPPRGDAVTSGSHQPNGSQWPRSLTSEERAASQRTGAGFPPASAGILLASRQRVKQSRNGEPRRALSPSAGCRRERAGSPPRRRSDKRLARFPSRGHLRLPRVLLAMPPEHILNFAVWPSRSHFFPAAEAGA